MAHRTCTVSYKFVQQVSITKESPLSGSQDEVSLMPNSQGRIIHCIPAINRLSLNLAYIQQNRTVSTALTTGRLRGGLKGARKTLKYYMLISLRTLVKVVCVFVAATVSLLWIQASSSFRQLQVVGCFFGCQMTRHGELLVHERKCTSQRARARTHAVFKQLLWGHVYSSWWWYLTLWQILYVVGQKFIITHSLWDSTCFLIQCRNTGLLCFIFKCISINYGRLKEKN